jgi:hypothetical protein
MIRTAQKEGRRLRTVDSPWFYLELLFELLARRGRGGRGWAFIFGLTPPVPAVEELTDEPPVVATFPRL